MSNEATATESGRKMVSVNGKELGAPKQEGNLSFIRPGKLTEADENKVVAKGIYEGTVPNNFDDTKSDFKVRSENGDLTILNNCASLAKQLTKVQAGSYVEITYLGKKVMTEGKYKGKSSHSFVVALDEEDYIGAAAK
jgi:hypothetical protein